MQAVLESLFWLLLLLALYSYFLYPLLLALLLHLRRSQASCAAVSSPSMSLVITVFNEEHRIRRKLENALVIDYPDLEIIVASDCSTDGTDDIVREYEVRGVRLVRAAERLGKENAQGCAIRSARGEVIVFSDAATEIPADSLRKMANYFQHAVVGAVSSEDRFIGQEGAVAGEGAYVRYEMWLRRMESELAGLVGLSGSFFAARKSVCAGWDIHCPSDFNTALNCARLRLRAVTAPDVLGYYKDLKDPRKEYQRKVRTVLRGITAVSRHPDVLDVRHFGVFAWQVWSHKLMRWAVPWLLALLFAVNIVLLDSRGIYVFTMVSQLVFYGISVVAHFSDRVKQQSLARIIYFFVQVNVAIADACRQFLAGKRMSTWTPSAR